MNVIEAVQEMKKGHKVEWIETPVLGKDEKNPTIGFNIKKTVSGFYDCNGDEAQDTIIGAILAGNTKWKTVEEKKTLSDKMIRMTHTFHEGHVKEALNKLLVFYRDITSPVANVKIKQKTKEIFGERLIE